MAPKVFPFEEGRIWYTRIAEALNPYVDGFLAETLSSTEEMMQVEVLVQNFPCVFCSCYLSEVISKYPSQFHHFKAPLLICLHMILLVTGSSSVVGKTLLWIFHGGWEWPAQKWRVLWYGKLTEFKIVWAPLPSNPLLFGVARSEER